MGRYLLGGKEARLPYEVEELNIRLYTVEELCYYIYHYLPLIDDDFIDERLLKFIRKELDLPEIAEKIERFYISPSDLDTTLLMLLTEVGFFSDQEIMDAQKLLGRTTGVFGEPAGVTGTAGVKKLCEAGVLGKNDSVVSIVTGNGLKDVANTIAHCGEPISIPSDMALLLKAFEARGIHPEG